MNRWRQIKRTEASFESATNLCKWLNSNFRWDLEQDITDCNAGLHKGISSQQNHPDVMLLRNRCSYSPTCPLHNARFSAKVISHPVVKLCHANTTAANRSAVQNIFMKHTRSLSRSRDISVGIATGYGLDDRGGRSSSLGRVKNFLFSTSLRPALGSSQPPIKWVPRALSPGVKRQGCQTDHSPPTSAEVKKIWTYTSTPPYVFMA
jgi:hypothetical protein